MFAGLKLTSWPLPANRTCTKPRLALMPAIYAGTTYGNIACIIPSVKKESKAMSRKEALAFDRVLAAVLTFNHCSACGPGGEVELAKAAVHAACLDYAALFPRRRA